MCLGDVCLYAGVCRCRGACLRNGECRFARCHPGRVRVRTEALRKLKWTARGGDSALFSCYTNYVAKNVTIKISDQAALWARRKAAEENSSVSRLVGEMLERQMTLTDSYWQAFEHWKSNRPLAGAGAAQRMSREEVHQRR